MTRGRAVAARLVARLAAALLIVLAAALAGAPEAGAQTHVPKRPAGQAGPTLPENLTPGLVDGVMARLSDEDVRALLREELMRQATAKAAAEATEMDSIEDVEVRLRGLSATIGERVSRWIVEIANIRSRLPEVESRLATAEGGVGGMIAATAAMVAAGVGAALLVIRLTAGWRRWLKEPETEDYWGRVVRSLLLLALDLAPVVVFVFATNVVAPLMPGALGPMVDYVWIYHYGVSAAWAGLVVVRRLFAPDAPRIRITLASDATAEGIMRTTRRVALIAVSGWLLAGLSPTLGFGFPPALVTVAVAGTLAALVLLVEVWRNRASVRQAVAEGLDAGREGAGAWRRIAAAAAPGIATAYLLLAWVYWLALWLESGTYRLTGPAGTLVVLLLVPVFLRLGTEVVRTLIPTVTARSLRYREVLTHAWKTLLFIVAVGAIAHLWGFSVYLLAHGPGAPRWAGAVFDILVIVLVARLVWQLILAAFHRERRMGGGEEGEELDDPAASSRLDTLIPLLRTLLLIVLAAAVVMMGLSELGVDIGPLLASAGIVGIAVGFGAQTLVRDIFSGAFFLIDDAFRVGEYIELDKELKGEVEAISVRSLQLRHHRGPVITVPFGELRSITNHNRDWVIYKMEFRLEPDTDPKKIKKLVKQVGQEFLDSPEHGPKFLDPLKSQGVYMVAEDSALVFRVKFKCKPRQQFVLRREIYHRLREVFAQNGVQLARRKVEVVTHGDPDAAVGALPDEVLDPKAEGVR